MAKPVELRVRISRDHVKAIEILRRKYNVSVDRVVEMAIERMFLSELGIFLVPEELVEKAHGIAVIRERDFDINVEK